MAFASFEEITTHSKAGLTQHKLKHDGVRAHGCDECGAKFTRKADLVKHVRRAEQQIILADFCPR